MGNLFRCGTAKKLKYPEYMYTFLCPTINCLKTVRDNAPVIAGDNISIVMNDTEDFWGHSVAMVSDAVDLTDINKIYVKLKELNVNQNCSFHIRLSTNFITNYDSRNSEFINNTTKLLTVSNSVKTDEMLSADVSKYNGNYYIYIGFQCGTAEFGYGKALISDVSFR